MNKYLIVVDLDGTLMLNFYKYERKAVRLLKKLNKKHMVMIATGRPKRSSIHMYKKMKLKTPIINYNGALIQHPLDPNFPVTDLRVNKDYIFDIINYLGDDLENIFSEIHDEIYTMKFDKFVRPYLHVDGGKMHIGPLPEILHENPNGAITFVKKGGSSNLEEYINNKYKGILRFRYWGEDSGIEIGEIYNVLTNKGTGIKETIKYYNLDPKYVMAIGDGHNDIEMFNEAGISVAVGNAHKDLIPHATFVVDSCYNKGVYKFLKNFFYKK